MTGTQDEHDDRLTVYKFRSLGSCEDLRRVRSILDTGKFWCSRFWELNDPTEGVYHFCSNQLDDDGVRELYEEKHGRVICSFFSEAAFSSPPLWGYYANGFKGIAIEVEVASPEVTEVTYPETLAWHDHGEDFVQKVLTTKLMCWEHEGEYRHIRKARKSGAFTIGTITAVHFGRPYITTVNAKDAEERTPVREYLSRRRSVRECAEARGIPCFDVEVRDGRVQTSEQRGDG